MALLPQIPHKQSHVSESPCSRVSHVHPPSCPALPVPEEDLHLFLQAHRREPKSVTRCTYSEACGTGVSALGPTPHPSLASPASGAVYSAANPRVGWGTADYLGCVTFFLPLRRGVVICFIKWHSCTQR